MFEWTSGSKHLRALALPHNSPSAAQISESSELCSTEGCVGEITALALKGIQVAYTRVAPWGEWDISNLWVQRPGQQPELIDSIETGGGAAFGTRTYLTPTIAGSWLYAYRQYHEEELGDGDPAWVRYSLTTNAAQQGADGRVRVPPEPEPPSRKVLSMTVVAGYYGSAAGVRGRSTLTMSSWEV